MKPHSPKTLVLCEGKDDELVMQALANHAGLGDDLVIKEYGGNSKLRKYLRTMKAKGEFSSGQYTRILITCDADQNYQAAVQSLKDAIQNVFAVNVEAPMEWAHLSSGAQITSWIIPGADQTGMIETLCLNASRANDSALFACLDPFMACLESNWGQKPHEKIRFGIWTIIAQRQKAKQRLSMERAIANIDFYWDDPAYESLRELFQQITK